jgi:hypothetical protein
MMAYDENATNWPNNSWTIPSTLRAGERIANFVKDYTDLAGCIGIGRPAPNVIAHIIEEDTAVLDLGNALLQVTAVMKLQQFLEPIKTKKAWDEPIAVAESALKKAGLL